MDEGMVTGWGRRTVAETLMGYPGKPWHPGQK